MQKNLGGLGLREMRKINQTSMIKAGWRSCTRRDGMWVKLIRAKYRCGNDIIPTIQRNKPGSNFWQGLCKNWNDFQNNLFRRVGDGKRVKFWRDCWVPDLVTLQTHATRDGRIMSGRMELGIIKIPCSVFLTRYWQRSKL